MGYKALDGELPMTITHQKLALRGRKTRTLRAVQYQPGVYKMVNRNGHSIGSIAVSFVSAETVIWTRLTPGQQLRLAEMEGYNDVAGFERAARRIAGPKFFAGTKGLYVHSLAILTASTMTFDEVDKP